MNDGQAVFAPALEVSADEPSMDLDSCASEPVHLIGKIQSHGLLFALSEPDFVVRQVSANVKTLIGIAPDVLLGSSIETVFGARQFASFRARVAAGDLLAANPLVVELGEPGRKMSCVSHRQAGVLMAEFELVEGAYAIDTMALLALAVNTQALLSQFAQAEIHDLCTAAAAAIREASGFDRVLIYRFDAEWNGEVVAAAVAPETVSYLGHHFPASDMPAQSRALFLTNPLRAIADAGSLPVPIVSQPGSAPQPLDLTRSFLRSASPIHIEFLRNWGVAASLTVSIVIERKLWGMVACHHPFARRVDSSTRAVCELIGQNIGLQVGVKNAAAAGQSRLAGRALLADYIERLEVSNATLDAKALGDPGLLELLDADGLVSRLDGVVSSYGVNVTEAPLLPIVRELHRLSERGIASSSVLGALDHSAESYAGEASGALYIELPARRGGDYVLFLRKELVQTVRWAGNPDKAVSAGVDGKLHPRTSFAAWQETLRGRSRPWTELQLESAKALRDQLPRRDAV